MAVQLIHNTKTNERGYQARWKGKSKYFSCRIHGNRGALVNAQKAEAAMKSAVPMADAHIRRGCSNVFTIGRRSPGPNGICFLWLAYSGGKRYPVIRGHFKDKNMALNNSQCSILKHGVYGACLNMVRLKETYGYPCIPLSELANNVLEWLKATYQEHPNNISMFDIPDIDAEGNLRVQPLESKTIMVVGSTPPNVNIVKHGDVFYSIRWVRPSNVGIRRSLNALPYDRPDATKAERMDAAEMLMLSALDVEADGYFVPVSNALEKEVQRVFAANELPIVVSGKTEEHGYTMFYK